MPCVRAVIVRGIELVAHTVRGAIGCASSNKRGLEVTSEKNEAGGQVDRIAG